MAAAAVIRLRTWNVQVACVAGGIGATFEETHGEVGLDGVVLFSVANACAAGDVVGRDWSFCLSV